MFWPLSPLRGALPKAIEFPLPKLSPSPLSRGNPPPPCVPANPKVRSAMQEDGFVDGGLPYLTRAITWLQELSMKAVLDLHALPGAQTPHQVAPGLHISLLTMPHAFGQMAGNETGSAAASPAPLSFPHRQLPGDVGLWRF